MTRYYNTRYMGNNNPHGDHEFHDLWSEKSQCQIDEILGAHHDVPFVAKEDALRAGFDPCAYCMPGESTR